MIIIIIIIIEQQEQSWYADISLILRAPVAALSVFPRLLSKQSYSTYCFSTGIEFG